MQALREEEENIAEEGAVEDIPLTYDRPDLSNKVTLRRSSTGSWKVCSSGQNPINKLGHSVEGEKTACKEGQILDSKETQNKRVLRSGKSCSVEDLELTATVIGVNGDLKGDPDYKPVRHLKDVVINRYSSRSLKELSGDSSSRTSRSDESFVESKVESDRQGNAVISSRMSSSSPSGDSTLSLGVEFLPHSNSTASHKYPTRQKSALHNNDSVA